MSDTEQVTEGTTAEGAEDAPGPDEESVKDAPEVSPKWRNVPPEELQKYLDQSGLQPGEDHEKWAFRNRLAEEKLLAKYGSGEDE